MTTSIQGKSAFPESHPLALGCAGRSMPRPVSDFLQRADVIFGIGCSFARTNFGATMPGGKTYVHATLDVGDVNKDVPVRFALVGDAGLVLDALVDAVSDRLGGRPRGRAQAVAAEIASGRAAWLAEWLPKLTSDSTPLSPYRVIWELMHTVDVRNTIIKVVDDPGIDVTWIDRPKPSAPSPLDAAVLRPIEQVTSEFWPGVPVMPLMATGASDSLYLRNAGIPSYGVSGLFAELNDNRAHGRDERVAVPQFYESLQFLYVLVKRLAT